MTISSKNLLIPAALFAAAAAAPVFAAEAPSNADLAKTIDELRAQIETLAQLSEQSSSAASKIHWGGYGEMHYNNLSADDASNDVQEIDFHRFVLFAGYDFSDKIRFVSELEVEHVIAADGEGGEVELEQAYIEFDVNDRLTARGGLMLIPTGITNETHEPPTFYGVERNDVEAIIVPSTWWAGGASATFKLADGLQWDVMVHEGLAVPTTGGSAFRIRSGRQKTSNAKASDLAYTTRLRYAGIAGLQLAASVQYQSDISQVAGDGLDEGLMYVANAQWSNGSFALRALYAGWELSGTAVEAADADSQTGWYLEPSFRPCGGPIGFYARYEDIDAARAQDQFSQWEAGINYYPHPQVVLKADFRQREHELSAEAGRDFDGFDLGIGYQF